MASSGEVLDFEEYVRNRQDALLRSARRLVPDPIEAQDLLQTALVRTYGRWDGIADKSLADAYLRRVMINTRTEWWRARKLDEVPTDELPDARVEDGTEQHADRELLMDILSCLAPKQRSVVVLRHWEQMSTEETAEALGMSTGTVKSTLHRALARLRQELESRDLDAIALERAERQGAAPTGGAPGGPNARVNGGTGSAARTERTSSANGARGERTGGARTAAARTAGTRPAAARPAAARTTAPRPAAVRPAVRTAGSEVRVPAGVPAAAATRGVPLAGVVRQRQPLGERAGLTPALAVHADRRPVGAATAHDRASDCAPDHEGRRERHDRGQARCAA